jgi:hypothetical protein
MNMGVTCVGVLREPAHSPGRIDDDAAIMRSVSEALSERGFSVELVTADAVVEAPGANMFVMCERGTVLDRLAAMEKQGSIVVNAPAAIRNTYRHRMVELFAHYHVPAPVSWIVAADSNQPRPADCAWVKRYDFHAGVAPFRRARHSLRHRAGACGGRPGQILRRPQRRGNFGRELVPMVLSS